MTFGLLELFVIGFTFVSAKWAPFHMPGFIPIKSTWDLYYQLRTAEIVGKFAPKEIDCALLESQLESIDSDHERFYLIEQFKSLSKCEIKLDQEANDDLLRTATTSEEVFYALSLNNYEMNDAKDAVMQKPLESVDQISFTLLSLTYIKAYSELDRVFKKADDWFERTYDLDDLTVLRFFDSYIEAAKHVSSGYLSDSRTRMIVDRILQIPTESQELLFLQLRILSELNEGNISKIPIVLDLASDIKLSTANQNVELSLIQVKDGKPSPTPTPTEVVARFYASKMLVAVTSDGVFVNDVFRQMRGIDRAVLSLSFQSKRFISEKDQLSFEVFAERKPDLKRIIIKVTNSNDGTKVYENKIPDKVVAEKELKITLEAEATKHKQVLVLVRKDCHAPQDVYRQVPKDGTFSINLSQIRSGKYDVLLLIYGSSVEPERRSLGNVMVIGASGNETNKPKPEIVHKFRDPDPEPAFTITIVFTLAALMPPVALFVLYTIGGQFKVSCASLSTLPLMFLLLQVAFILALCYSWVKLNMFQTMQLVVPIYCLTHFVGNGLLS